MGSAFAGWPRFGAGNPPLSCLCRCLWGQRRSAPHGFIRELSRLLWRACYFCSDLWRLSRDSQTRSSRYWRPGRRVGSRSMSEVKAEIAEDLRALRAPILVVLDDLDRLTPQETLEALQLIKANGDFPNLIYLILCERAVVENHIANALCVKGRD